MTVRVLVADDDPLYRRVLTSTLTGWGYTVIEANDGTSALALLEADADSLRL